MLFIFVTEFVAKNFVFASKRLVFRLSPLSLDIPTVWRWFLFPHPRQVWPYAKQTVFLPRGENFDTFRLISGSPDCCWMTFSHVTSTQLNEIHHHDRHLVLNFCRYSGYAVSNATVRTFYGEIAHILLWRPEFSRVPRSF